MAAHNRTASELKCQKARPDQEALPTLKALDQNRRLMQE